MQLFDPSHPGELILETIEGIREETGKTLTIAEVASGLGTTRKTLSALINGRQSVTPEMAVRLGAAFKNTDAEFWLTVQRNFDLNKARKTVKTRDIKIFWKPKRNIIKAIA